MNKLKYILTLTALLCFNLSIFASERSGFENSLRQSGLINVVVAVITVIFIGIVVYLVMIDRKLNRLEKEIKEKNDEA